jgi:hypothetical protein
MTEKGIEANKFIEILNWKKYQEKMPEKGATWFKVHCSLANCEAFQLLNYKAQMTLIALWLFAAESGRWIIKADPKYLFRKCRLLKEEPDLKPLLNAIDDYGRPNPFIAFCDAPAEGDSTASDCDPSRSRKGALESGKSARSKAQPKERARVVNYEDEMLLKTACKIGDYRGYVSARTLQIKMKIGYLKARSIIEMMLEKGLIGMYKSGLGYGYLAALEKRNTEKRREDKSREDGILTDSERKKDREIRTESLRTPVEAKPADRQYQQEQQNPSGKTQQQNQALMQAKPQDTAQKPVEPANPMESDVGAVSSHHVPTQPRTAYRGGKIVRIKDVLNNWLPAHWQDPDAEQFGWDMVAALGYPTDRTNQASRSEWGSFAAWYCRLKQVLPAVVYDELREIAIKKAIFIKTKARSARNKSAVWFKIMDGELASRGIRLPDSRASPAVG